jgi:hypothetical protein
MSVSRISIAQGNIWVDEDRDLKSCLAEISTPIVFKGTTYKDSSIFIDGVENRN